MVGMRDRQPGGIQKRVSSPLSPLSPFALSTALVNAQGRAKATKASLLRVPILPPPPAAITTYWRPFTI